MDEIPLKAKFASCCLILQVEEAKELVRLAIHAGIMSDLGSGSNIDICVITRDGVDYIRPYQESEYKDSRWVDTHSSAVITTLYYCVFVFSRKRRYKYPPGVTPVLTEKVVPLKLEIVHETVERMDTA